MLEQQPTQNPLTVSMLNAQAQQVDRPLRENVKQAVRNYLRNLDGQDPTELYELVLSEIEHPMLDMVMQHTRGNQTRAATMLGINRGT
ncbi:DNA-binding transcriptional regulator Fis, partial [Glaesserella parasuis]|nr:DNA-binding transcriptional regulator Fis [Glaesserella parasuis]